MTTIDWPLPRSSRRRGRWLGFALLVAILLSGGTALSYYVESLWFESLGFSDVFWTALNLRAVVFVAFTAITFGILYGSFLGLKPRIGDLKDGTILVGGQPIRLPIEPVIRLAGLVISFVIAGATGLGMATEWTTLALYWYGGAAGSGQPAAAAVLDPVFGRPLTFYFFTLPAWQLIAGWLTTLAFVVFIAAVVFAMIVGGSLLLEGRGQRDIPPLRGVSASFAAVLAALAVQVYLGRFDRIYADHTIFAGVTYTDAHVTITGMLVVAAALALGALIVALNAMRGPKL